MKLLIIIVSLCIISCNKQEELLPKFHYGDLVSFEEPFYKKNPSIGVVKDYLSDENEIFYLLNTKDNRVIYKKENLLTFIKSGEEQ